MAKLKLSPPWSIFYDEVREMFKGDPDVRVIMDEATYTVHVFVNDPAKSAAIATILEQERKFGRVTLKVQVPPPDKKFAIRFDSAVDVYQTALKGNPHLSYIKPKGSIFDTSFYVVFKNEVIQYFNDDISDVNGF